MKAVVTLVAALAVAMTAKVASGAATLQISFPAGNETASGVVRGLPAQPDFYHVRCSSLAVERTACGR